MVACPILPLACKPRAPLVVCPPLTSAHQPFASIEEKKIAPREEPQETLHGENLSGIWLSSH